MLIRLVPFVVGVVFQRKVSLYSLYHENPSASMIGPSQERIVGRKTSVFRRAIKPGARLEECTLLVGG